MVLGRDFLFSSIVKPFSILSLPSFLGDRQAYPLGDIKLEIEKALAVLGLLVVLGGMLFSCECPADVINSAPVITNQTITVGEDLTPNDNLSIKAFDDFEKVLFFSLIEGTNLFEFKDPPTNASNYGEMSLKSNVNLDYETTNEHRTTVQVDDGYFTERAVIIIKVTNINEAPTISNHIFSVGEYISDTATIGMVFANDEDREEIWNTLTYSIITNDSGLFEITPNSGELSLSNEQSLDFESTNQHHITVQVSDGELTDIATVTITVNDIADADGDGLIEIHTLTMLHNMRYNLNGTSYKTNSNAVGGTNGCPRDGCNGYELMNDLSFDTDGDGTWRVNNGNYTLDETDSNAVYFNVSEGEGGWEPIDNFAAIFEGNGFTITGLAIRRDLTNVGMFGVISSTNAHIRGLGLVDNLADYTGNSNGETIYIGGLVGYQAGGDITDSETEGDVSGTSNVGGLVGYQAGGNITDSKTEGDVSGTYNVGGLVGYQAGGDITDSKTEGYASGTSNVGGLVGYQAGGDITDSETEGYASGTYNVGGLVGYQAGGDITDSEATTRNAGDISIINGISSVGGLVGRQSGGNITASSAERDASGTYNIGGLVGRQNSGNITASYAEGDASGNDNIGGLVGRQNSGNITDSYATGNASGNGNNIGGLVGRQHSNSIITASYATGNASGNGNNIGGLVGESDGNIRDSYATGNASGNTNIVGGLVGQQNSSGIIAASYATGNANGINSVGGLVGRQAIDGSSITASYATGNADGNQFVGGLVGWQSGGASIIASYATGNANATNSNFSHAGGLVGNQNGDVIASYATGNVHGNNTPFGGLVGFYFLIEPIKSYGFSVKEMQNSYGEPPDGVRAASALRLDNAGSEWDDANYGTHGAWKFGTTANQAPPTLQYNDYDGSGSTYGCGEGSGATLVFTNCGSVIPGQDHGRAPVIVAQSFNVTEHITHENLIGEVSATDPDGDVLYFFISGSSNQLFEISTEGKLSLSNGQMLDLQSREQHHITVEVSDGLFSSTATVTVNVVVDTNGNGLIEIHTLTMLHHMRYNLAGTSYKTNASDPGKDNGCPERGCNGYELVSNLSFDADGDGHTWSGNHSNGYTLDSNDNHSVYFNVSEGGWEPINNFAAIFEGNTNTITGLAVIRATNNEVGMFAQTTSSAQIRNLGLVSNLASGEDSVGGLVGIQNLNSITACYATGNVHGNDDVGGLVGWQAGGSITACYTMGDADGNDRVGGLVGCSFGSTTASYATGNVSGNQFVGGLVGQQDGGSITASYATGDVSGISHLGGLVGQQLSGSITASYATGGVNGDSWIGGLVGQQDGGSITASYATGHVMGIQGLGNLVGHRHFNSGSITASYGFGVWNNPGEIPPVTNASLLTLSNAGGVWNNAASNTAGAWDFGDSTRPPRLLFNDYDETGSTYGCLGTSSTVTILVPDCGSVIPGQ